MHERRYTATIERLRLPQRVELLEIDRVVDLVLADLDVKSVLDVGTGSGIFAEAFAKKGIAVTGIDPNPDMLEAAKSFVPTGKFLKGTVQQIAIADIETRTLTVYSQTFSVLDLRAFDNNNIYGYDSPLYNSKTLSLDTSRMKVDKTLQF